MPPTSRGLLFLRLLRRHASTYSLPPPAAKYFPAKPPQQPSKPSPSHKSSSTSLPPRRTPSTYFPFSAPPGAPPVARRLFDRMSPPVQHLLRWTLRIIPWLPPLLLLYIHIPYQVMWITGPSMSPLLNPNFSTDTPNIRDRVLVKRLNLHLHPATQRGMVIVFRTPHDPDKIAVKRIIGIAGDRINPHPGYSDSTPIVVPYNHVWVEGDVSNRLKSRDSNWYGPISRNLIKGQVLSILTPWYAPRALDSTPPTQSQSRVEVDAVHTPNPDDAARMRSFLDGSAQAVLDTINDKPAYIEAKMAHEQGRKELAQIYELSIREVLEQDDQTLELATALVKGLERRLGREAVEKEKFVAKALGKKVSEERGRETVSDVID